MTSALRAELAAYHYMAGDQLLRRLRDLNEARRAHDLRGDSPAGRAVAVLMQDLLDEAARETMMAALAVAITALDYEGK